MPRVKVTIGLQRSGIGSTETYISPDATSTTLPTRVQELLDKRNACLTKAVEWQGVRLSYYGFKRRSVFYPPGVRRPFDWASSITIPGIGAFGSLTTPGDLPDQAKASLLVRLTFDIDRTTNRYFARVPDSVLLYEPGSYYAAGNAAWTTAFETFGNTLIERGWCIRAQKGDVLNPPFEIADWVSQEAEPSNMGFVLPAAPPFGAVQKDKVKIENVRRKGTDKLSYNGNYIVSAVNNTQLPSQVIYYLRGTSDGDPESIKLLGTARRIQYDLFPILKFEAIKATTHKRGKPLGLGRGRVLRRESLDP